MGFNDFQRGDREGYHGTPARPPQNADEAMGRAAGQERRNRDHQQLLKNSEGYEPIPPRFGFYAVGLFAAFALAKWSLGAATGVAMLLAATVAGLLMTRVVKRLLRSFTPVYVGLLGGVAVGSFSLAMTGAPLNAANIAVHVIMGVAIGIAVSIINARRRK